MKDRYCRTHKHGKPCGKKLEESRYFNCKDCVPELPPESQWDMFDDMDVDSSTNRDDEAEAA